MIWATWKIWKDTKNLTNKHMKKSELKQLIREVVDEITKSGNTLSKKDQKNEPGDVNTKYKLVPSKIQLFDLIIGNQRIATIHKDDPNESEDYIVSIHKSKYADEVNKFAMAGKSIQDVAKYISSTAVAGRYL